MKLDNAPIHLRLLGMAALWGASWPWGRVVAQSLPPLAAAGSRFLLASLVLLPWLYLAQGWAMWRRWPARRWLGMVAAAAAGVLGYSTFFMLGLQSVPAGKAALVVALNPVATLLLAAWLFGERLNRRIGLGIALAAAGALIVITHGAPWRLLTGGIGHGEWLLLGCVACWVAYTLIGRVVLTGVDALTTTATTSALGTLMLIIVSLSREGTAAWAGVIASPLRVWLSLAALAFGATALAYAWYFDGVKTLGAGAAAGYITLVPVFGVLFSGLWLDETIDASLLAGGSVAVVGMLIMHLGRQRLARSIT